MMTYTYDPTTSTIHLKASGILVASDAINYFRQLDEDPTYQGKSEERVYLSNLEDIAISYSDAIRMRLAFEEYGHADKLSTGVFIVDSELSYGMARMIMSTFNPVFDKFTLVKNGEPMSATSHAQHQPFEFMV